MMMMTVACFLFTLQDDDDDEFFYLLLRGGALFLFKLTDVGVVVGFVFGECPSNYGGGPSFKFTFPLLRTCQQT